MSAEVRGVAEGGEGTGAGTVSGCGIVSPRWPGGGGGDVWAVKGAPAGSVRWSLGAAALAVGTRTLAP